MTGAVLILTGFQLALLAAVLLVRATRETLRRNTLAAFLLVKLVLILRWIATRHGWVAGPIAEHVYLLSGAGFFLLAPLLYLHVQSYCAAGFRLHRRRHLAHLGPALFIAGLTAAMLAAPEAGIWPALARHYWDLFWTLNLLQILAYLLGALGHIRRYRGRLRETHSTVEPYDLRWLQSLLLLGGLHWVFVVTRSLAALAGTGQGAFLRAMDLFSILIFLEFTTLLAAAGLRRLDVAAQPVPPRTPSPSGPARGPGLAPDRQRRLAARLDAYMREHRPYLQPSLTVDQLARAVSLPSYQVSAIINHAFGTHFFGFVNGYRVEAAKRLLADPGQDQKTMLAILYEAGFQSKSSFNAAFKRQVGVTPSGYRKRVRRRPSTRLASPAEPSLGS